jgi:hypothetical protein
MNSGHPTTVGRVYGSRRMTVTRRAVEWLCWSLAIVLIAVYCGARGVGELERRQAIALFMQTRVHVFAEQIAARDVDHVRGGPVAAAVSF